MLFDIYSPLAHVLQYKIQCLRYLAFGRLFFVAYGQRQGMAIVSRNLLPVGRKLCTRFNGCESQMLGRDNWQYEFCTTFIVGRIYNRGPDIFSEKSSSL